MSIFAVILKYFVLMTPFFVLSVFVSMTENLKIEQRRQIAMRTARALFVCCMVIYFLGEYIFHFAQISLDSFRIAAGLVLLLSGIDMVRSSAVATRKTHDNDHEAVTAEDLEENDPSVVPLAIPCTIGPGTIGALLMNGIASHGDFITILNDIGGVTITCVLIGALLYYSHFVVRLLKQRGLAILSKLTGLFLASLAIQIMADGVCGFIHNFH